MLRKSFHQSTEQNRLVRLVLVFALVFAAVHVALHDLDVGSFDLDGQSECQACRLNHTPAAATAAPVPFTPLQFLATVHRIADAEYQTSHSFHPQWARAPPLL